jgi:dephospho-CoA kinase
MVAPNAAKNRRHQDKPTMTRINYPIIFIIGLTGVGKSTTLSALKSSTLDFELLPNRRELADTIIIPEVQRAENKLILSNAEGEQKAEKDRLERFRLTAKYREMYPAGMVHALQQYLSNHGAVNQSLIFDNIRGLDECKAAVELFTNSRFIFLDAPPMIRLKRLIGRGDSFDQVAATRLENDSFIEKLLSLQDAGKLFDVYEVARLDTSGIEDSKIIDAVQIILTEHQNYNSSEAANYLKKHLDDKRLLYLDTSQLSIEEVTRRIQGWL